MHKKAALEAEIWGKATIKDLNPSHLKHIHDRVGTNKIKCYYVFSYFS